MVALVDGTPQTLSLKQILAEYIRHRQSVITRRTEYELKQAKARAHILEGLKIALDHLDAVIKTIRESADSDVAKKNLMDRFGLSELQAIAILDMQLRRLAALERKKIEDELAEIIRRSAKILNIEIEKTAIAEIAKRSRRTPRIANRILKRVRDWAEVKHNGKVNLKIAQENLGYVEHNSSKNPEKEKERKQEMANQISNAIKKKVGIKLS